MSPTLTTDIAFSSSDALYAWNISMTVNTTTGAGTCVQPGFNGFGLTALTFDTSGRLLGAGSGLYSINTATSATTFIGPIGFDVRGMAFTPVPEPSSFVLTLTAIAGLFATWRKRRDSR